VRLRTIGDRRRGVKPLKRPARTRSLRRVDGEQPRDGAVDLDDEFAPARALRLDERGAAAAGLEDDGVRARLDLEAGAADGEQVADLDAHRGDARDLRLGRLLGRDRDRRHRCGQRRGQDEGEGKG
jgi:hypothetical protein